VKLPSIKLSVKPRAMRGCFTSARRLRQVCLGFGVVCLAAGCQSMAAAPNNTPKNYTNLLVAAGATSEQVNKRIDDAFKQLFYGDPKNQAVYFPAAKNTSGPLAYIMDINSNDVRSEGMSYGMMIAVQLNKKAEFDALWNWAKTYMYHTQASHPAKGFFSWSMKPDGTPLDEMPAPDGEEYFITALYFASARWGNGEGIYAYSQEADQLLMNVRHRETITGPTVRGVVTAVNLFDEQAHMVRFTPDIKNAAHTDASYHLPAFYEVWARMGPASERAYWIEAARVSRDYFVKAAHPKTGLTPDYGNFDGSAWAAPWNAGSADFRYDAWRTAMNWSMDWVWWQADPRQVELSNRIQTFFMQQGLEKYESLYSLDGKKIGGGQTTGIVAMNAAASLAANHPQRLEFVKALWNRPIPAGQYRYYDGMLYMFGLLHTSGNYRLWLKP
jgi:oligosaccharide reducing-end xylanase